MPRSLVVLAGLVVAGLVGSGCGASSGSPAGAEASAGYATDGTFTIAIVDDLGAFDPYRGPGAEYFKLAYDPLVHLRPDGTFASGLAQDWTVDAESATFTLRPDVTCSDGTPLTASQVAADLTWLGDPANQSPQYGVAIPRVPFTATGDDAARTVTVVMEEPFGLLLYTIGVVPIMCGRGLADPAVLESASDGTGPFVLTEVQPGQSYTFSRRDGYVWGPDGAGTGEPGVPATVVLRVVSNESTAANLLLTGEVNFAAITGQDRQRLDAQGLDRVEVPFAGAWLWFNQIGARPTAEVRVRQALVHALDLAEIVKVNTGETGGAATGLVAMEPNPCAGGDVADRLPGYDVAAAESLLDEAGWVEGADGARSKNGTPLTIALHYGAYNSPLNEPTAELIARQWRTVGVEVTLSGNSLAAQSQVLYETSNFDVYVVGFNLNLPSQLLPFVSGPVPPEGSNFAGIDNPDYAALTARAQSLTPPEACTDWGRAEEALVRNVDIAPIAFRPRYFYLSGAQAESAGFDIPVPMSIRVLD